MKNPQSHQKLQPKSTMSHSNSQHPSSQKNPNSPSWIRISKHVTPKSSNNPPTKQMTNSKNHQKLHLPRRKPTIAPQKSNKNSAPPLPLLTPTPPTKSINLPTSPHQPKQTRPRTCPWLGPWKQTFTNLSLLLLKLTNNKNNMTSKKHITNLGWSTPLPKGIKTASNWVQLISFGTYSRPEGIHQFTRSEANEVVNYFYSLRGRISRFFKALPISMHNTKPCGHIIALEARDKGLWGFVKWNETGQDNLKRKFAGWIIPTWVLRSEHPDLFTPFKLLKVHYVKSPSSHPFDLTQPLPTIPKPTPTPPNTDQPLNTKSITENLIGHTPIINNRKQFIDLVYSHMIKTGDHYLQSWTTTKHNNPNLLPQ